MSEVVLQQLPLKGGGVFTALFSQLDLSAARQDAPTPPVSADLLVDRPVLEENVVLAENEQVKDKGRFQPKSRLTVFQAVDFRSDGAVPLVDPETGKPITILEKTPLDEGWRSVDWEKLEAHAKDVIQPLGFNSGCIRRVLWRSPSNAWYCYEDAASQLDADKLTDDSASSFYYVFGDPPHYTDLPEAFEIHVGGPYSPIPWALKVLAELNYRRAILKSAVDLISGPFPIASESPEAAIPRIEWLLEDAFNRGWQLGAILERQLVSDVVNRDARKGSSQNHKAVKARREIFGEFADEQRAAEPYVTKMEIVRRARDAKASGDPLFDEMRFLNDDAENTRYVPDRK